MQSTQITPTKLQPKGWARVSTSGAHLLRRGAWYPVVRISSSGIIAIDVNRHVVPVDKRLVELRYHRPERWSVVRLEPAVLRRVPRPIPPVYGVCPVCRHRQTVGEGDAELTCERCHQQATVAWEEVA